MLSQSWQPESERLNKYEKPPQSLRRGTDIFQLDKRQVVIYTVKCLALVKQNYRRQVLLINIILVVWITEVWVKCFSLLPLCLVDKRPLEVRYSISWLWATLSHTFDRIGRSDIDLLLLAISWSPSLDIDFTLAIFHTFGKHAERSEVLIIEVRGYEIAWRQSLNICIGILLIPGTLFGTMFLTITSTWLHLTGVKENCSDVG